jgi:hypothetical protein
MADPIALACSGFDALVAAQQLAFAERREAINGPPAVDGRPSDSANRAPPQRVTADDLLRCVSQWSAELLASRL